MFLFVQPWDHNFEIRGQQNDLLFLPINAKIHVKRTINELLVS